MKNNVKTRLYLALPLLALLASCGSPSSSGAPSSGGSTPAPHGSSSTSGAAAEAFLDPSEVPDDVSISFWSTGSQAMTTTLQTLAVNFEKAIKDNTGKTVHVEVTVEGDYDTIADKVTKGLSVGNIPTMAVAYPDSVANFIYQEPSDKRYVYDINNFVNDPYIGFTKQSYLGDTAKATAKDIVEAFYDEGTHYVREGRYSYPFMKSSEVMFYNVDNLERAYQYYKPSVRGQENIEEDLRGMSWEEFGRLLASVEANKDKILSTLQIPAWYDSDENWFITQMFQRGIGYSSIKNGSGSIDFESGENRTKAEAMVADFKRLYDDNLITTRGIKKKYGSEAFTKGEVLFEIGSSGGTGYNMPEGVDPSKIGVIKVPSYQNNDLYVSQGPTICFLKNPTLSETANKVQAYYGWQFAKYLTNPANNVRLCIVGSEGYLPIRYSCYSSDEYLEFLSEESIYAKSAKVLMEDIDGNYFNTAVFPGSAQLRDKVGGILPDVFTGAKQISGAFTDAIAAAKDFIH